MDVLLIRHGHSRRYTGPFVRARQVAAILGAVWGVRRARAAGG